MFGKLASVIMLSLLVICMLALAFRIQPARSLPATIIVPDDYPTIQAAIDHASDGDTIHVKAGVYYEHISSGKSISLVGEGPDETILDGNGTGTILEMTFGRGVENLTFQNAVSGAMLQGFSGVFRGNVIRNCSTAANEGLWIGGTCDIENNTFLQNYIAMILQGQSVATMRENRFTNNMYGFGLSSVPGNLSLDQSNTVDGYPMYYFDGVDNQTINEKTCPSAGYLAITRSNNITIENLAFLGKNWQGLYLRSATNFTIANVTSRGNLMGIELIFCSNGTMINSTIEENMMGIRLSGTLGTEHVSFKDNVFKNNSRCFDIAGEWDHVLTNEIDTSNSVDGGIAYFFKNMNDTVLDEANIPNAGFLGFVNSNNVTVRDLKNMPGLSILVDYSSYMTITNVSARSLALNDVSFSDVSNNRFTGGQSNDFMGIEGNVHNSTFDGNYIWKFNIGLAPEISDGMLVVENTIEDCITSAMLCESDSGRVLHNNFINDNQPVWWADEQNSILWDDGYPSGGNYWSDEVRTDVYQGPFQNVTGSDGIADVPYINGLIVDRYPLAGPWTVRGENVTVTPSNAVTLTFGNTTSGGITVVNSIGSGPDPPSGFKLESANPQYYDINTTANYDGPITIGVSYNDTDMTTEEESALRLMHWNATASMWTDITTSVDTTNNVVYGETEHLSTFIVVWPIPPVDMRVRKVYSKSVVGSGYVLSVNLTVENQGYLETMFNVSLYANNSTVDASSGIDLQGGVTAPIYLAWNTSGVGYGNYTLTACVPPSVNETDILDNNCSLGLPVHVGVPGDVSGTVPGVYDGVANMKDIAYLVSLFNTKPSSPNWDPNADVNNDGFCNMKDIAIAVYYFNQHE